MGRELRHETVIDAPPATVWDTLVDVDAWPDWNPTLLRSSAPLEPGRTVKMRLRLGPFTLPMKQRVLRVEAPRLLLWRSINGFPGLMDVDRRFELFPGPHGTTTLTQSETARGPLRPVLMPLLHRWIHDGYVRLGTALRRRIEVEG
jgi:hypothetical protein